MCKMDSINTLDMKSGLARAWAACLLSLVLLAAALPLQAQEIMWQTCVGGTGDDNARAFEIARDGCYMVVGSTHSYDLKGIQKTGGDADMLAVKINSKGVVLWKKSFGGSLSEEAFDVKSTRDGGFFLVGSTDSKEKTKGEKDFYVVRIDALGQLLWQKSYGGVSNETARALVVLPDSGAIIVGETASRDGDVQQGYGGIDGWAIRIDRHGKLLWSKTFGGKANEQIYGVTATADGNFLLVGATESTDGDFKTNQGKTDVLLVKIDKSGNTLWAKTLGGNGFDTAFSVTKSYDGKIAIAGTTSSTAGEIRARYEGSDAFIAQLDDSGALVWYRSYGGSGNDGANSISPLSPIEDAGGYLIAGTTSSRDGDILESKGKGDAWLFKVDPNGQMVSQRIVGGTQAEQFYAAKEVPSNDFVAIGYSLSTDADLLGVERSRNNDFWVAAFDVPSLVRSITPTTITGYIRNAKTKKYIEAEVRIVNNARNTRVSSDRSDTTFGIYQVFLPDTDQTSIGVFAEGFFFFGKNIDISPEQRYSEIRLDIELRPIVVDSILDLYNINFETGKINLTEDSKPELERIVEFLKLNPRVHIQINGHTDATGPRATKVRLSELRADQVKKYLVDRGIQTFRLRTMGYGMDRPKASEDTEEGRRINRRVEIQITRSQ